MSIEQPEPGRNRRSGWAAGALAILVLALVLVGLFYSVPRIVDALDDEAGQATTASGVVRLPAKTRQAAVAVADATKDAEVAVNARGSKDKKGLAARVVGPNDNGQFNVVLAAPAPAGGAVAAWQVRGLPGTTTDSGSSTWATEWGVVLIIMVISLLAALAAYWMAVWRRQAGSDGQVDVGPELASFLKVAALLMIGAFALIAVMMATPETSLSALFGLFGTIAGYLAGNRSETSGGRGRGGRGGPSRVPLNNEPDDDGEASERQREQYRMSVPETRSLL